MEAQGDFRTGWSNMNYMMRPSRVVCATVYKPVSIREPSRDPHSTANTYWPPGILISQHLFWFLPTVCPSHSTYPSNACQWWHVYIRAIPGDTMRSLVPDTATQSWQSLACAPNPPNRRCRINSGTGKGMLNTSFPALLPAAWDLQPAAHLAGGALPREHLRETRGTCQELKRNEKTKKKEELNRKRGWGIITKQVFLTVAGRNPNPCI